MRAARGIAGRTVLSLAQQTSLSLLGTLAATTIVAGLKAEWPLRRDPLAAVQRTDAPPALTSGGKFADRAAGDRDDAAPAVILTLLPPVLPLFTAPVVPALEAAPPETVLRPGMDNTVLASPKPSHPAARRRIPVAVPVPPRREPDPLVVATATSPGAGADASPEFSLWARSKSAYRQVAAWSGALTDHLIP